jgi:hypothetical protein
MAEAVVGRLLLLVLQNLIASFTLLEAALRVGVVLVAVRVQSLALAR